MVRPGRAFASLLVALGVLTSAWATCAEGAVATPTEQMACCKAGHHDCPMTGSASDCCKESGSQVESQGTIVKAQSLDVPVPVPMVWATLTIASAAQSRNRLSYDASPPGLLIPPPAYIAFSTLLI